MTDEVRRRYFHMRLIDFITSQNRLFKCEWISVWKDFQFDFQECDHMSPQDAKGEFFDSVLPRIFSFELTTQQINYLKLLDNYPGMIKTEEGYVLNPLRKSSFSRLQKGSDYQNFREVQDISDHEIPAAILTSPEDLNVLKKDYCVDSTIQSWCNYFTSQKKGVWTKRYLSYDEIKERLIRIQQDAEEDDEVIQRMNFHNLSAVVRRSNHFRRDVQELAQSAMDDST